MILVDEDGSLGELVEKAQAMGIKVVRRADDISHRQGMAVLTDEFSGREYFGTKPDTPIKYQGERFENFEFGVTLPKFDQEITDPYLRVRDFFIRAFDSVDSYNQTHEHQITGLIYKVDQLVLSQKDFRDYFDAFLDAYKTKFLPK